MPREPSVLFSPARYTGYLYFCELKIANLFPMHGRVFCLRYSMAGRREKTGNCIYSDIFIGLMHTRIFTYLFVWAYAYSYFYIFIHTLFIYSYFFTYLFILLCILLFLHIYWAYAYFYFTYLLL